MEIDNSNNRDDERRAEQRKDQSRLEAERRHKLEPMKTFEAKLSEKASTEEAGKRSQQTANRDLKKGQEDKQKILSKILDSAAKNRSDLDHNARVQELEKLAQRENGDVESKFENKLAEDSESQDVDEDKPGQKAAEKSGEIAEEGYRRVAEKQEGGQDSGGSFGGQGESQEGEQQGGGADSSGSGAGSGSGHQQESSSPKKLSDFFPSSLLTPLRPAMSSGQQGFQQDARAFTQENMDEIVDAVSMGINREGEEFFAVELSDKYYEGLKLVARRTPQGVVLRFDCPNVAVRSTFIKHRPQIYARLKAKNISVFRIDVI